MIQQRSSKIYNANFKIFNIQRTKNKFLLKWRSNNIRHFLNNIYSPQKLFHYSNMTQEKYTI